MTSDEQIERLMRVPPPVLSRRDRIERIIMRVCGVVSVAAFVLAAVAGIASASIATCVNTNLGTRSAPSAADAQAHIDEANALVAYITTQGKNASALLAVLLAPPDQQPDLYAKFLQEFQEGQKVSAAALATTTKWAQVLAADQDTRNRNPLGHC